MRSLMDSVRGTVDLGVILMIGIAFAGLVILAYLIWTIEGTLITTTTTATVNSSLHNITGGFDDAVNLLLVAITIFILAIAISALLLLRGR